MSSSLFYSTSVLYLSSWVFHLKVAFVSITAAAWVLILSLCLLFFSRLDRSKASGVDGRPLDGVPSVRVLQDTRFESDGRAIRCTEVRRPF